VGAAWIKCTNNIDVFGLRDKFDQGADVAQSALGIRQTHDPIEEIDLQNLNNVSLTININEPIPDLACHCDYILWICQDRRMGGAKMDPTILRTYRN